MALLCYRFSIRNTLEIRSRYMELSQASHQLQDTPRWYTELKLKEHYYDSLIQGMNLGDTSLQNNLLQVLNRESQKNDLKIVDFSPPHIFTGETNSLYTYSFGLDGGYRGMIKTLYSLEQKGNFGEIVHAGFEKKKNYRTNRDYLVVNVLIQQLK